MFPLDRFGISGSTGVSSKELLPPWEDVLPGTCHPGSRRNYLSHSGAIGVYLRATAVRVSASQKYCTSTCWTFLVMVAWEPPCTTSVRFLDVLFAAGIAKIITELVGDGGEGMGVYRITPCLTEKGTAPNGIAGYSRKTHPVPSPVPQDPEKPSSARGHHAIYDFDQSMIQKPAVIKLSPVGIA